MVDIVEVRVSSDILTGNSSQTYQRYFWTVKFLIRCLNIFKIIEGNYGEETGSRTLRISHIDNETLFVSWIEDGPLLVRAVSEYV